MRQPTFTLRQAFWIVCVCVLLLPHDAAAEAALAVDIDGDGQHDHFVLDRREPSILHIWLSASNTTQAIRTHLPLLQLVAIDLDGDYRPELVARDGHAQIHVWTRKHTTFHPYRPHHELPDRVQRRSNHSLQDTGREPSGAIPTTPYPQLALTECASPCAPQREASATSAPHSTRLRRLLPADEPFAPRPPPLPHVLL